MQRSLVRLAPKIKGEVPPNMALWWKAYAPMEGQIVRHTSPFNTNVIGSLFHNAPNKLMHKVTDNFFDVAPALVLGVGVVLWADSKHEQLAHEHRD